MLGKTEREKQRNRELNTIMSLVSICDVIFLIGFGDERNSTNMNDFIMAQFRSGIMNKFVI